MKLYKYTFSDGTFSVAPRIEDAIYMQRAAGRSTRVIKMERTK